MAILVQPGIFPHWAFWERHKKNRVHQPEQNSFQTQKFPKLKLVGGWTTHFKNKYKII